MSATINLVGITATVDQGKWACADPAILGLLQARAANVGDSPSIPDLDEELARDATTRFGALWVKHSDKPHDDPDLVY